MPLGSARRGSVPEKRRPPAPIAGGDAQPPVGLVPTLRPLALWLPEECAPVPAPLGSGPLRLVQALAAYSLQQRFNFGAHGVESMGWVSLKSIAKGRKKGLSAVHSAQRVYEDCLPLFSCRNISWTFSLSRL